MKYSVEYTKTALKQLKKMDRKIASFIISYVEEKLVDCEDPIIFTQGSTGSVYHVDTEDAETKEVPIGNISGYLIDKNDGSTLFWNDNDRDFMVNGNLEPNELIKIAESLEENK